MMSATATPMSDIADLYLEACAERDAAEADKQRMFAAMVALVIWTEFELPAGPQSDKLRLALEHGHKLIDEIAKGGE